jgi:hypothetical protein
VAADQLSACGEPAQPPAHGGRWYAQLGSDRAVPHAVGLGQQRLADHTGQVQPPRQRHARQQHVRRPTDPAAATARTDLEPAGQIAQPPRPGKPPAAKHTTTARTSEHARTKVLLDPDRVAGYDQHSVRLAPSSTALSNC